MIADTRPWLPRVALLDGALSVGLTSCADRWADAWFGDTRTALARLEGTRAAPNGAASWRSTAPGLQATLEPTMEQTIARWMLDLTNAPQKQNAADLRFLRDLSHACVEDFLARACAFFQLEPRISRSEAARASDSDVGFSLSVGAARVLDLTVSDHIAAAARKALAPAQAPEIDFGDLADALAPTTARIGIMLGTARLGLTELASLACGDVLVLDRGQKDSVPLTINGQVKVNTGCDLHQDGSHFRLRVSELQQGGGQ